MLMESYKKGEYAGTSLQSFLKEQEQQDACPKGQAFRHTECKLQERESFERFSLSSLFQGDKAAGQRAVVKPAVKSKAVKGKALSGHRLPTRHGQSGPRMLSSKACHVELQLWFSGEPVSNFAVIYLV